MSTIDRFREKVELTNISEYFDDLDDMYFFDVAVQGYYENDNKVFLEELLEEVYEDFNDYKVVIVKQSYPYEVINAEFMSDNINISVFIV